jgi:hypothetical protein
LKGRSPEKLRACRAACAVMMLPLLAAALACGAAAPPACAGTLETRSSLGLSEHVPGTPRDVLYVFDHPAGDCAYLARFDEDGSRRVSVFKLGGAAARAVRLEATPFPAFIRSDDRSVLVRWVRRTSGLPVHNLVEVKERCWPVFTSYTGIDSEPLLELSAVYPGRPSEPVPPVPSVSDETLQKALVTDPGTDADAVQAMLGLLEDARELGTMDLSAFDGSETVAVIQKRAPQAPRDVVTTLLTGSGLERGRAPGAVLQQQADQLRPGGGQGQVAPGGADSDNPARQPGTEAGRAHHRRRLGRRHADTRPPEELAHPLHGLPHRRVPDDTAGP